MSSETRWETSGGLLLKLTHFFWPSKARFLDGSMGVYVTLEPEKSFLCSTTGIYDHYKLRGMKVEKISRKFLSGLDVSTI